MLSVNAEKNARCRSQECGEPIRHVEWWVSSSFRYRISILIVCSVFSKCADTVEDGRRLENLSWRIWARETLCCETQPKLVTTPAIGDSRPRPKKKDVPALSSSVESEDSDEPEDEPKRSPRAPSQYQDLLTRNIIPTFLSEPRQGATHHLLGFGKDGSFNTRPTVDRATLTLPHRSNPTITTINRHHSQNSLSHNTRSLPIIGLLILNCSDQ